MQVAIAYLIEKPAPAESRKAARADATVMMRMRALFNWNTPSQDLDSPHPLSGGVTLRSAEKVTGALSPSFPRLCCQERLRVSRRLLIDRYPPALRGTHRVGLL